jgi:hypothetical protein
VDIKWASGEAGPLKAQVLKVSSSRWYYWEEVEPLGGRLLGHWGHGLERNSDTLAPSCFSLLPGHQEQASFAICFCPDVLCHQSQSNRAK